LLRKMFMGQVNVSEHEHLAAPERFWKNLECLFKL